VIEPWHEVCARLGRTTPFLSYVDLIVGNWRHRNPANPGAIRVENLRLLVPTVGVDEEQFFYLTQLEMLARGTPLVAAAARACAAVAEDDAPTVAAELDLIAETITDVTREGLPKINPRPGTRFHVDPVVWAKTVAPLAVPLIKGGLGPSGTASPMFHLTDAVIGRTGYQSFIGEEAAKLRQNYPPHWRALIEAVAAAGISRYADHTGHPILDRALADLRARYSGEGGLLWRHRLKVAGYLDTSFRVGRDVTISGFPAAMRVGEELAASRGERPGAARESGVAAVSRPTEVPNVVITPAHLLLHHRGAERKWIGLRGDVVDLTDFLRAHPGGVAPLAACLGTDASAAYEHIEHHRQKGILARAASMVIGELRAPVFPPDGPIAAVHDTWLQWAIMVTQRANVMVTDLTIRQARTSLASTHGELTPYTLQFAIEAHERFIERIFGEIVGSALGELEETVRRLSPTADLVPVQNTSVASGVLYRVLELVDSPPDLFEVEGLWQREVARDETFLHDVRETLRLGVEAVETRNDNAPERLGAVLGGLFDSLVRAAQDYAAGS
jgi:cytochrome b involved in lipid metabolism